MAKSGKKRKADYEANHARIRDAYLGLLKAKKGRKPTLQEIADCTGMGVRTVHRHLEELTFEPRKHSARMLTDDVVLAIYRTAMKGSSQSQALWMKLMEGWSEKESSDNGDSGDGESVPGVTFYMPDNGRDDGEPDN